MGPHRRDGRVPVVLELTDELPPEIVVNQLVDKNPVYLLQVYLRGPEKEPGNNDEPPRMWDLIGTADTLVNVQLSTAFSVVAHELFPH